MAVALPLWGRLLVPVTKPAGWQDVIASVAAEYMNGVIQIVNPSAALTPYDPVTGQGGEPQQTPIFEGPARIQHIRFPRETPGTYQWGANRYFRFQIDYDPAVEIQKGFTIYVTDGGRDVTLEALRFEVISAVNSSHRAVRTIEAVTDGVPVAG